MSSEDIVNKIKMLAEEISSEVNGNPAHLDTYMIQDTAKEIDELQEKLWELES